MQMLQKLARKQAEAARTSTDTSQTSASSQVGAFQSQFESALIKAGLDSSQLDAVRSDIQSTMSSVIGQSDGTTDPREAVREAVDKMLQEKYGVDTDKLNEQMRSSMGSRPPGPPPGGAGGPGGPGGGGSPEDFGEKVTSALESLGLDSSQVEEISSEITSAVSSMMEDSHESGDPDAVKNTVHETLAKYGIDTDAFDEQMEAGMKPSESSGDSSGTTQSSQSLDTSLISYLSTLNSSSDSYSWLSDLFQLVDVQA